MSGLLSEIGWAVFNFTMVFILAPIFIACDLRLINVSVIYLIQALWWIVQAGINMALLMGNIDKIKRYRVSDEV